MSSAGWEVQGPGIVIIEVLCSLFHLQLAFATHKDWPCCESRRWLKCYAYNVLVVIFWLITWSIFVSCDVELLLTEGSTFSEQATALFPSLGIIVLHGTSACSNCMYTDVTSWHNLIQAVNIFPAAESERSIRSNCLLQVMLRKSIRIWTNKVIVQSTYTSAIQRLILQWTDWNVTARWTLIATANSLAAGVAIWTPYVARPFLLRPGN